MKTRIIISILMFCSMVPNSFASWAYPIVVYDGKVYVISDEEVEEAFIDEQIGEVTYYAEAEGTYSGNFSNVFPKGTEYYSIRGISPNKEIAVKSEDGIFIKAIYNGEYAGESKEYKVPGEDPIQGTQTNHTARVILTVFILFVSLYVIILSVYMYKSKRKNT